MSEASRHCSLRSSVPEPQAGTTEAWAAMAVAPAKAAESLRRPGDRVLVRNSNSNSRLGLVLRLGATPNRRSGGTGMTTMIVNGMAYNA